MIYSAAEIVKTGTNGCYSTAKRSPAPNKRRAAPFATQVFGVSGSSGAKKSTLREGFERFGVQLTPDAPLSAPDLAGLE